MTLQDPFAVRVDGLAESLRGLNRIEPKLKRAVSQTIRRFVDEITGEAEQRGKSLGGVHRHAVDGGGVRVFNRATAAGVKLAGSREPTVLGAEFGSKQYAQFPPWRGNQFTDPTRDGVGYFLHPTMRDRLPGADDELLDSILDAIAREIGTVTS